MKQILCYGDSDTWGKRPDAEGRYEFRERWPGILEMFLGPDYRIIEEGCCGRTTVWEDPVAPYRDGSVYLTPCLHSHKPLDLMILMLGSNDAKSCFSASAETIARGMKRLVKMARYENYGPNHTPLKILLVSPMLVGEDVLSSPYGGSYDAEALPKLKKLAPLYQRLAEETGCGFLDAARYVKPGADQLHMDAESHRRLAEVMAVKVREMLESPSGRYEKNSLER